MGNIGDYTDIELTSIHAVLRPAVRSGFEHRMGQPAINHPCKVPLYIWSIRGSDMEAGIQNFLANNGIDRGNQPGF